MNVRSVRAGLNANLATVSGLQTYDFVPAKAEPPCAIVKPHDDPFLRRETMGVGHVSALFDVIVLVGNVVDDESQDKLDDYIKTSGSGSVWAAIESDKTAGGAASDLFVQSIAQYGEVPYGELSYLGAVWLVQVLATG